MEKPKSSNTFRLLVERWRADPGGAYRTWFLWEERLKNFRSIRRGLQVVSEEIAAGRFGNVYKGSSLETVVGSVAEQKQIFKGADHAFLWKPKLRIPDIYEDEGNQKAFGAFLSHCSCCAGDEELLTAVRRLDTRKIKGLGPAVANLLYFLHPTHMPPFNTAIVKGYNAVTGSKVKLGRWEEYLAMRAGVLRLNAAHRDLLSNDLGAAAALLFDIGSGRYPAPPIDEDADATARWEKDLEAVRAQVKSSAKPSSDVTHTEVQGWLRDLGKGLGYDVWVASNDRNRPLGSGTLGDGCLDCLPDDAASIEAVAFIDVLWLDAKTRHVCAAFEVEHTTSIYSGIVRLLDLALGARSEATRALYLVAPDDREEEVRSQLGRPAFRAVQDLHVRFLPYGPLREHRESMARFGEGLKAVEAVAKRLT